MATYTMELRKVCDYYTREEVENWFKSYNLTDYLTEDEINSIENAGVWNKNKLAKKIVDHYFVREIGFETPGLFQHYAKITMEEIMEEKLPLIYSSSIKYDPLVNVDYTESFERSRENSTESSSSGSSSGSGTSNSESSANSLTIQNNTPQKRITTQDLDSGAYASSVNQNDTTNEDTTTNSTSSQDTSQAEASGEESEEYTKRVKGNSGVSATAQKMVEQYRQNIIAIDREIINELNILFMGLF